MAFPEVLSWRRRQSWVIITNLAQTPLTVWASLLRDSGPEKQTTLTLAARSRTGREVGAWFALGPGDSSDSLEIACSVLCAVSVVGWDVSGTSLINPTPMPSEPVCGY